MIQIKMKTNSDEFLHEESTWIPNKKQCEERYVEEACGDVHQSALRSGDAEICRSRSGYALGRGMRG
jgi:hypothetical protein